MMKNKCKATKTCKELATHVFHDVDTCYFCLQEYLQDEMLGEVIEDYIDTNIDEIK